MKTQSQADAVENLQRKLADIYNKDSQFLLKTQKRDNKKTDLEEAKPKPTPKLEDIAMTQVVSTTEEEKKEPAKPAEPVQKLDKFFVKTDKKVVESI